jgi:hypothetical protein
MTVRMACVDAVRDRWDVFDGVKRIGRSLTLDAADRLAAERAYDLDKKCGPDELKSSRAADHIAQEAI